MSRVLSKPMMSRVTPAELESLAMFYRELLQGAAHVLGRETKVYLHWTAGHYGQFWSDYHIQIDKDGGIYVIGDGELDGGATVEASALPCLDVLMQQRKA